MLHTEKDTDLLLSLMENILQESRDRILFSNEGILPFSRAIIAEKLFSLGYSKCEIGRALHKNHSTIFQAIKKINEALKTPGYEDVRALNNMLIAALKQSEKQLTGITPDGCIWKVAVEDRLCNYCKVQNCTDRKP